MPFSHVESNLPNGISDAPNGSKFIRVEVHMDTMIPTTVACLLREESAGSHATAEPRTRRPLLKRACLWTAAMVLVIASYLAGAPVVAALTMRHQPSALPILVVVYAPIDSYLDARLPGSTLYERYAHWVLASLE